MSTVSVHLSCVLMAAFLSDVVNVMDEKENADNEKEDILDEETLPFDVDAFMAPAEGDVLQTPPASERLRVKRKSTDSLSSGKRADPKKSVAKVLFPGGRNTPPKPRSADKKPRAERGTAGTFAGRRPPKDAEKLAQYEMMKADYKKVQAEIQSSGKKISLSQSAYWTHMKKKLDADGPCSPRTRFAAASKEERAKLGLMED